jgi:hypothetical protein
MASPNLSLINASTPIATPGGVEGVFDATLAASGAWTRSSVINVKNARKLTLYINYDPGAIGGYPGLIFLGSNGTTSTADAQPATDADSWFQLSAVDGSVTSAVGSGTLAAGSDFTIAQPEGWVTAYPMIVRLTAATNAADEYRQAITIDVTPFRWVHFQAAEVGVTATPGALSVEASTSA